MLSSNSDGNHRQKLKRLWSFVNWRILAYFCKGNDVSTFITISVLVQNADNLSWLYLDSSILRGGYLINIASVSISKVHNQYVAYVTYFEKSPSFFYGWTVVSALGQTEKK